jgi:hypothetical protein
MIVTLHLNQIKLDHSTCITGARAIMKASMLLYFVGMIILTTYGNKSRVVHPKKNLSKSISKKFTV